MEKNKFETHRYRICPECDFFCNSNEPDKYCSICGAKLIDFCPTCGKAVENPYANFCKYCGQIYPGRTKTSNKK